MKIQFTVVRTDNGHEPWVFVESRYPDLVIGREQMSIAIERFNQFATGTGQVPLNFTAEIVSEPLERISEPNKREAERLSLQPK